MNCKPNNLFRSERERRARQRLFLPACCGLWRNNSWCWFINNFIANLKNNKKKKKITRSSTKNMKKSHTFWGNKHCEVLNTWYCGFRIQNFSLFGNSHEINNFGHPKALRSHMYFEIWISIVYLIYPNIPYWKQQDNWIPLSVQLMLVILLFLCFIWPYFPRPVSH